MKWMEVTDAYLSTDFFPPDYLSASSPSYFPLRRTGIWQLLYVHICARNDSVAIVREDKDFFYGHLLKYAT